MCVFVYVQRIVGFSILSDLYRNETAGTNPFLPVFIEALEKGSDISEKKFLVLLLSFAASTKDVRYQLMLAISIVHPELQV